jgi:hypothetical protein
MTPSARFIDFLLALHAMEEALLKELLRRKE